MKTNLQLIEAYVKGDDGALVTLFSERGYYGSCYFKALKYVREKPDAHTVAGDTFLTLRAKSLEQRALFFERGGRTEAGFRNYMLTVAENKAKDQYARRPKPSTPIGDSPKEPVETPATEPDEPHPSELFFERNKQVDACAEKLKANESTDPKEAARKPPDSEFLELWRSVGDYDNGSLREAFDLSDEQIRITKQRIMRRLRRCLNIQ
jgi:DNA-directed RNA polymerase specialized sigma24 family protein